MPQLGWMDGVEPAFYQHAMVHVYLGAERHVFESPF